MGPMEYDKAAELLASLAQPVGTCRIPLAQCGGAVLAQELTANENVPAFDRSPYDGYAFRAEDTRDASREHPAVLQILEEIPAGSVPSCEVTAGTAVKILTGAPIPRGADAVIMYEKTEFTKETVSVFAPSSPGDNIIYAGEDVKKGQLLAASGMRIDAGLAGTLASQGVAEPEVFRKVRAGIISTGSELVELEVSDSGQQILPPGKIRNTNRYMLEAALGKDGCTTEYLGIAGDDAGRIADLIRQGLNSCDVVVLTGGVSAGDYDLTPQAMEQAGCEILFRGVGLKPGMACCYGIKDGKLVCGLSGNPSSALTNYYAVLRPSIRKMTGLLPYEPERITVILADGFGKKSGQVRILKGKMKIENGRVVMYPARGQGNVMISSSIGCDVLAIVPAGSGKLEAGTELEGFLV